jgi:LCP family protein required for cell wall assembly
VIEASQVATTLKNSMAQKNFPWLVVRQIVFWAAALALSSGLFSFVRDFTTCWRLTALPGLPPASCASETRSPIDEFELVSTRPAPTSTPEAVAPEEDELPAWDGASRINILFVGLRGGEPQEADCPFCTDTLILLTVDPVTKTAGMLSIPRDMWVNIPGFSYSRINTAWTLGRGSKLPGGGPALTMKTVSHFIGVPVDYYVQVDFDTFVDVVDMIGGVDIYNDEDLLLDPVAHGKDYPKVRLTCCGERHMNGPTALAYARCRHAEQGCTDGDFGRARRQQKVILAIREKVFSAENFPVLLAQAPELYNRFSEGIHTNMSLEDAIKLAILAKDISIGDIQNKVIDSKMTIMDNTTLGGQNASVLRPLPDRIRILRDEMFTTTGPLSPLATGDPVNLMQIDDPRIRILNGTSSPGLEARVGRFLLEQGIPISENGSIKAQTRTTIVLYSPKLYALKHLLEIFEVTRSAQILIKSDPTQTVDIEIRVGSDWINKFPP